MVEIDDFGPAAFIVNDNETEHKKKIMEWAIIVAKEVEKMQK